MSRGPRALLGLLLAWLIALAPVAPSARAQDDDEPLLDLDEEASSEDEGDDGEAQSEDAPDEGAAEGEAETDAEAVAEEAEAAAPAEASRSLAFHIAAGLGAGTLSFERPIEAEMAFPGEAIQLQRLPTSPFAAADLEMRLHFAPDDGFSFEFRLLYQTSLGFVVQRPMLFALPQNLHVRTQDVSLSAAPVARLGDAAGDPSLAFPVGFAFQAFTPETDQYGVLEYSFGGLFLRPELWLELGEQVSLRLGPEAQWLLVIDNALRREGVGGTGLALGAQGTIEARLGSVFRLALVYRESHASIGGARGDFSNVERFLTARLAGAM